MPTRRLPSDANLIHLKQQSHDLLKGLAERDPAVSQRIREFHPRFAGATDSAIFGAKLGVTAAQLVIAREHGFPSWPRLKSHIDRGISPDEWVLPHHERIEDLAFRHAVDLLDAGDPEGLRSQLQQLPNLHRQHVVFEGGNYFRNPTLLEFVAENPIRHGTLPHNIVDVAKVILDAGVDRSTLNETLTLVSTGSVARQCGVQVALIDLICDGGADPSSALRAAVLHGEFEAARALIGRGARVDLPVAAALGRMDDFGQLLAGASKEDRHLALAMAAQFGHVEIVRVLMDAGEDSSRYNPVGGHSHATPLHQAALGGYVAVVRLLVERGARVDLKDVLWHGTPADWARYAGRKEIESYLRSRET